jgi:Protein of unknown function (DUF3710)
VSITAQPSGPYDVLDAPQGDGIERLDLGALLLPPLPGVDINAQVDESTGAIGELTLMGFEGAVQLMAFAAPKSGGYWDEVRQQLEQQITDGGATFTRSSGRFGTELLVTLADDQGHPQPARFCGVDGPRWFLRAVFLGAAVQPGNAAAALEQAVASLVVVRGKEALPVGAPLPLRMPTTAPAPTQTVQMPDIFARGPEITEIR